MLDWLRKPWPRPRSLQDFAATALIGGTAIVGLVVLVWMFRYSIAIHRVGRGVGDTVFLGADGKPWFRLDDHRRDVPIDKIAPVLRQAVIAVEDHRFYRHVGIDPSRSLAPYTVTSVRAGRCKAEARSRSSWPGACSCRTDEPSGGRQRRRCSPSCSSSS